MMITLFVLFLCALSAKGASTMSCSGLESGYYCIDSSRYAWCYGQATPTVLSCSAGLSCLCGKTASNPCGWSWSTISGCSGKPGDYIGGSSSAESPESTPSTPPVTTPSESSSASQGNSGGGNNDDDNSYTTPGTDNRKIIGYFDSWSQYHLDSIDGVSCRFLPSNIDPSYFTHINYAFAVMNEQYEVTTYEWDDEDFYSQLQAYKSSYPKLKTFISIGGWNFNLYESTKYLFSKMASTKENRAKFIKSAIAFAHKYGFDGIDLDWEYPGWEDQGGSKEDTPNFTLLLKEMREAIEADKNTKLLFTIAAPAGYEKIDLIEVSKFHKYLDWLNVMTYDFHGAWEDVTGPHTPLYYTDNMTINYAINRYLNEGVPANKIVMGLAVYGRAWTLQDSSATPSYGSKATGEGDAGVCTQTAGFLNILEIENMINTGGTLVSDEDSVTSYVYNGDQFVTFDTMDDHAKKVNWACNKGLGGVMIWDMNMDNNYKYIKPIYDRYMSCVLSDTPVESSSSENTNPEPEPEPEPESESSSEPGTCNEAEESQCDSRVLACINGVIYSAEMCDCIAVWKDCLNKAGCDEPTVYDSPEITVKVK